MLKSIKLAILGLCAASATFTLIPEANAFVKTTENVNVPLITRRYRRRKRRVRVIRRQSHPVYRRRPRYRYRRRPRYRTRRYRRCSYRIGYYRGIPHRYRVCRYYHR